MILTATVADTARQQFIALRAIHRMTLRVGWDIWGYNTSRQWEFVGFWRMGGHTEPKGKGNGATALREVCALADTHDITLTLATDIPRLIPYYESFGFQRREISDNGLRYSTDIACFKREPHPC